MRTLLGINLLYTIASAAPQFGTHAQVKRSVHELRDSYDYIVIGGGTSGLTVANRLSEDPSSKLHSTPLNAPSLTISNHRKCASSRARLLCR